MIDVVPLLAFWSLGSAWMLLWALSASLPILIHLLSRRRYHEVTWAAMEFLLAAVRKKMRRIRIEQIILLTVRTLILALLGLALADPLLALFSNLAAGLAWRGQSHVVLVLDGSYSMALQHGDSTRFDAARQLARQLIEESDEGDGFSLVLMAEPPQTIIGDPAFDPRDVAEELAGLKVRHGGASLLATLEEVVKLVEQTKEKQPRLSQVKICFFTDLGLTTWEQAASAECGKLVERLPSQATLSLVDVGRTEPHNLAVTRLDLRESLVTVGRAVTFEAEVQDFGTRGQESLAVEFHVDDRRVAEERIDVPPGSSANVAFTHRFETPGEHHVEARLAADPLEIDNHRWLSVPVRESLRVLCVAGREGAARFVALALEPTKSDRPRVRIDVRSESALVEQDLDPYDAIFLCNVGRFGRDEANVLHGYLKNGGGLVFCLGDQVQVESYNEELGGERSGKRVLPARLEAIVSDAQYTFDPLDYRHPIIRPFENHRQAGLLTTPVWKYFRCRCRTEPHEGNTPNVALAFENGDPALIEETILRGRSILFATDFSPDSLDRTATPPTPWTLISSWPSFPPLIQEILAAATRGRTQHRNLLVAEPLEGLLPASAPASLLPTSSPLADIPLAITTPDGRSERVPLRFDGPDRRWTFDPTNWSGIHEARFGSPLDQTQLYAVNLDTRESSLERFDAELLPSRFHADVKAGPTDAGPKSLPKPSRLFRWLLGSVLVLLLTETFLAWYFGSR